MSEQRCENCRFWEPSESPFGRCRRLPPTRCGNSVAQSLSEMEDGDNPWLILYGSTGWGWPVTEDSEWCGEWQASGSRTEVNMTLEEAGASGRLLKSTRKMGIRTVEQLSRIQRYDLYCQRHVGEHTLAEAESILEQFGLKFLPPS